MAQASSDGQRLTESPLPPPDTDDVTVDDEDTETSTTFPTQFMNDTSSVVIYTPFNATKMARTVAGNEVELAGAMLEDIQEDIDHAIDAITYGPRIPTITNTVLNARDTYDELQYRTACDVRKLQGSTEHHTIYEYGRSNRAPNTATATFHAVIGQMTGSVQVHIHPISLNQQEFKYIHEAIVRNTIIYVEPAEPSLPHKWGTRDSLIPYLAHRNGVMVLVDPRYRPAVAVTLGRLYDVSTFTAVKKLYTLFNRYQQLYPNDDSAPQWIISSIVYYLGE